MTSKDKETEAETEAEIEAEVAGTTASKDAGEEKPTAEMVAALAKLQDKGADVSSSSGEVEQAIAGEGAAGEGATGEAVAAVSETSAEATNDKPPTAKAQDNAQAQAAKPATATHSASVEHAPITYVVKQDALGRAYATGKRKNSIVRVWVKRGQGKFLVNGRVPEKYFARDVLCMIVRQPFEVAKCENSFDVMCTAKGGGLSGQAGALKHGISRALCNFDPQFRPALKNAGFLTRDARIVERKKYGKPKARRSFQFSKR